MVPSCCSPSIWVINDPSLSSQNHHEHGLIAHIKHKQAVALIISDGDGEVRYTIIQQQKSYH